MNYDLLNQIQDLACDGYGGRIVNFRKGSFVELYIRPNLINIFKGHLKDLINRRFHDEEGNDFYVQLKGGFMILVSDQLKPAKESGIWDVIDGPAKKKNTQNYDFIDVRRK
ncbi:MAG: hypothetical protein H8E32_01890 [Nitrospinae bacterium]|nr:hypothetical protein [Nitrospinota bacterium]